MARVGGQALFCVPPAEDGLRKGSGRVAGYDPHLGGHAWASGRDELGEEPGTGRENSQKWLGPALGT